ncbi:MAG: type II TA system antitoxin MqsA family protein [bacterium]
MCDHEPLKEGTVEETIQVGEVSYTAEAPAMVCPSCGESYLSVQTMGQIGWMVAADLARQGVGTPDAFRYMRKRLALKAIELAELLGVSPEAISRWEHGVHTPDTKAVKLLGIMILEHIGQRPMILDYLRSLLQVPEPREPHRRLPALSAATG